MTDEVERLRAKLRRIASDADAARLSYDWNELRPALERIRDMARSAAGWPRRNAMTDMEELIASLDAVRKAIIASAGNAGFLAALIVTERKIVAEIEHIKGKCDDSNV